MRSPVQTMSLGAGPLVADLASQRTVKAAAIYGQLLHHDCLGGLTFGLAVFAQEGRVANDTVRCAAKLG